MVPKLAYDIRQKLKYLVILPRGVRRKMKYLVNLPCTLSWGLKAWGESALYFDLGAEGLGRILSTLEKYFWSTLEKYFWSTFGVL